MRVAEDGVEFAVSSAGQDWRLAWYPPPDPPPGVEHGSAAVCVAGDRVVLVSEDGRRWGLPGGRPEPGESWAETLRREVDEEACATVVDSRLLGYGRGVCVRGHEEGLVLVRAQWWTSVAVRPWTPRCEMRHRRLVPAADAYREMWVPGGFDPLYRRIFLEAGLPDYAHGVPDT